jgi:hypothetical protein
MACNCAEKELFNTKIDLEYPLTLTLSHGGEREIINFHAWWCPHGAWVLNTKIDLEYPLTLTLSRGGEREINNFHAWWCPTGAWGFNAQIDHMEGRAPSRPNSEYGHDRAWPSIINRHPAT